MSTTTQGFPTDEVRIHPHPPAATPSPPRSAPPLAMALTDPIGIRPENIRRTRRTVDLSASQHRALDIWQRQAADRLGLARVTGQEVLTALIDQLLVDRELSVRITRTIRDARR